MGKLVIDPITRIEGHLRIEANVEGGKVKEAYSAGMLWRGIEKILEGRDVIQAGVITQRICGVCTYAHYEAAILAIEDALKLEVPTNARLVRNMVNAAQMVFDHVHHFYLLEGFDFVDVTAALKGSVNGAYKLARKYAYGGKPSSWDEIKAAKDRLQKLVDSGQLGFADTKYWGAKAYKIPPDAHLLAATHYLKCLEVQREVAKAAAIFGGKHPHLQFLVPGGVTSVMDILNVQRIFEYKQRMADALEFINNAYIPDLLMAVPFHGEEALNGIGAGCKNYLSFGLWQEADGSRFMPSGAVFNADLGNYNKFDPSKITEDVKHSWYDGSDGLHPHQGETNGIASELNTDGTLKTDGKYSYVKAPRYDGKVMEVGPLARLVVGYAAGQKTIVDTVNFALNAAGGLPPKVLFSTIGRTLGRALNAKIAAEQGMRFADELIANIKSGDTKTYNPHDRNVDGEGVGFAEPPRGALSHWLRMKKGKIEHYQIVVPSTWNLSPRDSMGQPGPVEQAVMDTMVEEEDKPVEILRTVHSFDPCLACGIHVIGKNGKKIVINA